MNGLLDDLHEHCHNFLHDLKAELDKDGGFVCDSQIHNMKCVLSSIEKIARIKTLLTVK